MTERYEYIIHNGEYVLYENIKDGTKVSRGVLNDWNSLCNIIKKLNTEVEIVYKEPEPVELTKDNVYKEISRITRGKLNSQDINTVTEYILSRLII